MNEAFKEVIKNCSTCLSKGIDGNFEPCTSCLAEHSTSGSHPAWKPWKQTTEQEFRRRLTEGE